MHILIGGACAMGNTETTTTTHGSVVIPGPSRKDVATVEASPRATPATVGMKDARGVERGRCKRCRSCTEYAVPPLIEGKTVILKCINCDCPPGAHENLTVKQALGHPLIQEVASNDPLPPSQCSTPGCSQPVEFDPNTGAEYPYCADHINTTCSNGSDLQVVDVEPDPFQGYNYMQPPTHDVGTTSAVAVPSYTQQPFAQDGITDPQPLPPVLPSGAPKCAIPECPNPCHIDESGKVHDCCGYTHAMEYQRRLAIQQQHKVIKGVTHCLLPGCLSPTWPFKNYCGRSHADIGQQKGLKPPAPQVDSSSAVAQTKDSSLCLLPGCNRQKWVENGITHPYCGKTHAQQGKQMGIVPTAEKVEDQCELPGCTKPRRQEGTRVHEYCCLDHASQDAPNRDARILTSATEVQNFLDKFKGTLNVLSLEENQEAKPGGQLFKHFKEKMLSLPRHQQKTCLAFHGTSESNIPSICKKGYDTSLRSGQAYGAGEYFATSPAIPLGYCKGGRKILLNELLLGQQGTHHTQHGDIIVMKDPAHDLPRFVITFR